MRIATFNLENLDLPLGPRAAVLRPALERLEADIVCLQEVNGQHVPGRSERVLAALDELLAPTAYADFHRASTTPRPGSGAADVHNLVTLSRYPVVETRQICHDIVPPADVRLVTAEPASGTVSPVRFERPILVTSHEISGQRLTVVNVHFRSPLASLVPGQKIGPFAWRSAGGWAEGYYLSAMKRAAQALELRLVVDDILARTPDALLMAGGDFNAEDHETAVRIAAAAPEDTGNSALAGRSLVILDRGIEASRRYSVLHHGRPQMVDHLLASQRLYGHFRSIEVHNEALGDELVAYSRGVEPAGSYHAAVVAEFDL